MTSPSASGRLARFFIRSKLTPLLVLLSLALGVLGVVVNAREEEPSITVAMADVFVAFPGRSAAEVDERIARPFSTVVRELPTVEHVMSTSSDDGAMLVVQFKAGVEQDRALATLYERLAANLELLPSGAPPPLVKKRGVEDVPVLALTLWDERGDAAMLRRIAAELQASLLQIPGVSRVELIGGSQRSLDVRLDARKLAERGLAADRVAQAVQAANVRLPAGAIAGPDGSFRIRAGGLITSAQELGALIVGANAGGPVYLRDIATVADDTLEPSSYVSHFAREAGWSAKTAVTIVVTKTLGVNAADLSARARSTVDRFASRSLSKGTHIAVTRDAGQTATERVTTLVEHMLLATLVVVVLVGLALGRREALIVAIVIPVTLAIVPLVYWLTGFTLNRITLAAMIFAIGILVDDAIVIIENIHRHYQTDSGKSAIEAAVEAVHEVGNPTILATFTVIGALLPTAFVTGTAGQYIRPLPVGASIAMLFSLVVALTVTPFLSYRLLRHQRPGASVDSSGSPAAGAMATAYRATLAWLTARPWRGRALWVIGMGSFALVLGLIPARKATVRILPLGDSDEMAVVVDLPVQHTLQSSYALVANVARKLSSVPEIDACQIFVGTPGPLTFQGVARHYMLRQQANQSELQIQLQPKSRRSRTSHEIAGAVRAMVADVLRGEDATFSVAEVPVGPPVRAAVVAEVYGPTEDERLQLAREVRAQFERMPGVVDVDWSAKPAGSPVLSYDIDHQRAALRGVVAGQAALSARALLAGDASVWASLPSEREPVPIVLRVAPSQRATRGDVETMTFASMDGTRVPATDVGAFRVAESSYPRLRRDRVPMIAVTAESVGAGPVYAALDLTRKLRSVPAPKPRSIEFLWTDAAPSPGANSIRWAGEWTTTYELFRDLAGAFAVVVFLLYVMMVGWYQSFLTPLVVMLPIPLSLLGVIPAHILFGLPLTGMAVVGVIALAGLMVRNSILLVDFARSNIDAGMGVGGAVLLAAQTRLRPIALTALTVILGDGILFFDPLLKGLGLSMAGGALVSTALTLSVVPLAYFQLESWRRAREAARVPASAATKKRWPDEPAAVEPR